MNDLISALIIAIIQGITEWIPVSSSGHLFIFESLLGYKHSLTFDVALHFGTLMSVFVYFGRDITNIAEELLKARFKSENGKLGIYLIIATIPAGIAGFVFNDVFEQVFLDIKIVALGFGITGLFLIIGSFSFERKQGLSHKSALIIGIAQVFSLFPGISRSGTALSTGLILGLKEKTALKFSFLMAIPIVFGANILEIGNEKLPSELIWATLVSFIIGLLVLHVLYKYVLSSRRNLRYFGAYALLLGIILFSLGIIATDLIN